MEPYFSQVILVIQVKILCSHGVVDRKYWESYLFRPRTRERPFLFDVSSADYHNRLKRARTCMNWHENLIQETCARNLCKFLAQVSWLCVTTISHWATHTTITTDMSTDRQRCWHTARRWHRTAGVSVKRSRDEAVVVDLLDLQVIISPALCCDELVSCWRDTPPMTASASRQPQQHCHSVEWRPWTLPCMLPCVLLWVVWVVLVEDVQLDLQTTHSYSHFCGSRMCNKTVIQQNKVTGDSFSFSFHFFISNKCQTHSLIYRRCTKQITISPVSIVTFISFL